MMLLRFCYAISFVMMIGCTSSCSGPDSRPADTAPGLPQLEVTVTMAATQPSNRPLVATLSVKNIGITPWVFSEVAPPMVDGFHAICTDSAGHISTTSVWQQREQDMVDANPSRTLSTGEFVIAQVLIPNPGSGTWAMVIQPRALLMEQSEGHMVNAGPSSSPVRCEVVDDEPVRITYDNMVGDALVSFGLWSEAASALRQTTYRDGQDPGWWLTKADAQQFISAMVSETAFQSTPWISLRSIVRAASLLNSSLTNQQSTALLSALAEVPALPEAVAEPILRWSEVQHRREEEENTYYSDKILGHLSAVVRDRMIAEWRTAVNPLPARQRLIAQIINAAIMNQVDSSLFKDIAEKLAKEPDARTSFLALSAMTWLGDVDAGRRLTERILSTPQMERTNMALHALTALPPADARAQLKRFAQLENYRQWAEGILNNQKSWPLRWME